MSQVENMMNRRSQKAFRYLGYQAPYGYDAESKIWEGGLHEGSIFLEFCCETEKEAEVEFHFLLDAYLTDCAENGETPEPPGGSLGLWRSLTACLTAGRHSSHKR
jgi:hypothetical protein